AMDAEPYRIWRYEENENLVNVGRWTDLSRNIPEFEGENGPYESQNSYNMVIAVHPRTDQVVYLGGTNLYVSSDGFQTNNNTFWIAGYNPEGGNGPYPTNHPDQHAIAFLPSDPDKMYVANDGGIYYTENNLSTQPTWSDRNEGYVTSQFYSIAIEKETGNSVMGGMQDRGTYIGSAIENSLWDDLLGGDGGYASFTKNGIYRYLSFQNGRVFRYRYNGGTLAGISRIDPLGGGQTPGREYLFVTPFVLDPNNNNIMYLAGGDAIWRNNNLSQMPDNDFNPKSIGWTRLDRTVPDESIITALEISTTPANRLYYGTLIGELYRVDDANTAVDVTRLTDPILPENAYAVCIAIDPTNADHFLVIYANYNIRSIFRTLDGGSTFEDIGGNLEENPDGSGSGPSIRWGEIVPLNDGTYQYFVGTSSGLFASTTSGSEVSPWIQQAPETIGNAVVRMLDYRSDDGWLVASTHGNGVYETFVDNALFYQPEIPSSPEPLLAFPNPFSDQVILRFSVQREGNGAVAILDSSGKLVSVPLSGYLYEGDNQASWDGTNDSGVPVADGMYYYQIRTGNQSITGKLILDR
ncbi:MAG: T9SS type A sorting domain-containing protein, partial [Bacteroidota bacterium]